MRIAFFHELHFGGARRVVVEYGKVFAKNHEIELFYIDREKEYDIEKVFRKSHFYKFNFKKYEGGDFLLKAYKDLIEPIKLYFLHKKIANDVDKGKFDFVFIHPSQFTHAPFILRFLKTPHLYFCQEPLRIAHDPIVGLPKNISLIKKIYEIFIRNIRKEIDTSNIKHAKAVIANSNYSKQNIKKAYGIESYVCYLGADPSVFKPLNIEKEYDLIFVGNETFIEGYDTFKEIVDLFDNKLKVRVVKPKKGKYITDEDLAGEYNKAKVLVVLGRFDPFSMIPWEGMSCEVVPVVVKEGGPVEALDDGNTGFLVERDPKKFKKIIEKLLNNEDLRNLIGQSGRKQVLQKWNWEKSSDRIFEIINKKLKI